MKRKFILVTLMIFFSTSLFASNIEEDLNKSLYYSIGMAAGKAAGLPVEEVTSIANALKKGDLKNAFLNLASWASDSALDLIPLYGPAKFAVELVNSFGNVLYTYLGNEVIKSAWNAFLNLDDSEKQKWLNGEYVPEIDQLYGMRLVNKDDMRNMFSKAWKDYQKQQENAQIYMDAMAKISKVIKMAKNKLEPSLFFPSDGSEITTGTTIELWRAKNNYFKLVLTLPDGSTYTKFIKDPTDPYKEKVTKFKLAEFEGVDWNKYFKEFPDGVNVKINVTAAVYDYTGLMKTLPPLKDLITEKENLVLIEDLNGKIFEKISFNFKVVPGTLNCQGNLKGVMYFDFTSDVLSDSDSVDLSETISYQCNPSTGKASLLFINDSLLVSGTCNGDGVGKFSLPIGCGNLTINLTVYCNPLKISFNSSGSCSQTEEVETDDQGNMEAITITIKNLRGTLE